MTASRQTLERTLVTAERYMTRAPDAPVGYELAGRARRALGSEGWEPLLIAAAERYAMPGDRRDLAATANLLRLAGDPRAGAYWELALEDALGCHRHNGMRGEQAAAAAYFLVGAVDVDAVFDEVDDGTLGRWRTLRAVRDAEQAGDVEGLAAQLERWRRWAASEPVGSNGSNPSAWDMVDHLVALVAAARTPPG